MHAAANVTTEAGVLHVAGGGGTVLRQTGRHASTVMTTETQVQCVDGRYIHTGFPPRYQRDFTVIIEWLATMGLDEQFEDTVFLQIGSKKGVSWADLGVDPVATEVFRAGRDAQALIARNLSADDFFIAAQERGLACGAIYSPEEALQSPHFAARGFPVEVEHKDAGRTVTYPGAPFVMPESPWRIASRLPRRRAQRPRARRPASAVALYV